MAVGGFVQWLVFGGFWGAPVSPSFVVNIVFAFLVLHFVSLYDFSVRHWERCHCGCSRIPSQVVSGWKAGLIVESLAAFLIHCPVYNMDLINVCGIQ